MTITLPLKEFLDLITYNGLFDSMSIPSSIGHYIHLTDPKHIISFVEPLNDQLSTLYYPIESYINEQKRRHEIEKAIVEHRAWKEKQPISRDILEQQLIEAVMENN